MPTMERMLYPAEYSSIFSWSRFSTSRGNKIGLCYLRGKTYNKYIITPIATHLATVHIYKKRETSDNKKWHKICSFIW